MTHLIQCCEVGHRGSTTWAGTVSASARLVPTFGQLLRNQVAVREILLIAQLMAFMPGEDFQDWVDSRPPVELCGLYESVMIDDSILPGGMATDPCQ